MCTCSASRTRCTEATRWMLTQSVYANACASVCLYACVKEVKGTEPQDTDCPKQDGRAMFGLPHTPFLCSRTVAAFFGLNRDCALHTRQEPTGARGILRLQINYLGAVAFKTTARFRSVSGRKVSWIQKCDVEPICTHGPSRSALRHFERVALCISRGPHLLASAVFPRPSVTR